MHAARGAPQVGIAHHVSFMRPYGLKDVGPVVASNAMTRFNWVDKVCHKLDYIGINYYGQVRWTTTRLSSRNDDSSGWY